MFLGEKLVVWFKEDGLFVVLQDCCCYCMVRLFKGFVENGNIVCGYYGWIFNGEGVCVCVLQSVDGSVLFGVCVKLYFCKECYGYVWVVLEELLCDILEFFEDGVFGYWCIFQFYECWEISVLCMMENFFDNFYFSYVYCVIFGLYDQFKLEKYEIEEIDYGFEVEICVFIKNVLVSYCVIGSIVDIMVCYMFNCWYLFFVCCFGCIYLESGCYYIIYNCVMFIDDGVIMLL